MFKSAMAFSTVCLLAISVWASKASMNALQQDVNTGSNYLLDERNIFIGPNVMLDVPDYVAIEMGSGTLSSTTPPYAEGGFIKKAGDLKYGLQIGRRHKFHDHVIDANSVMSAATGLSGSFAVPNNSFELMVAGEAGIKWGVMLGYVNVDAKSTKQKLSDMALGVGLASGPWAFALRYDLGGTATGVSGTTGTATDRENVQAKTSYMELAFSYLVAEGMTVYLGNVSDNYKITSQNNFDLLAGTTGVQTEYLRKYSKSNVGFASVTDMDKTNRFFWAEDYEMTSTEPAGTKTDTTALALTAGVEAEANSWMVLRASVKQPVLISTTKTGSADTDSHSTNGTTVAAGTGLKFGKATLDTTLSGSTTGTINGSSLLANASLNYRF